MKHSKKRGYFPFVQWKMLKEIAYLERKNKQSIERLQLRYDNLSSLCRYIKQAIGDMDSDLQFKVDYMVKLLEKKYRMIYINEITGEPYLEIDEREPTEEEWENSKKIKYDFKDKEIHKGAEGAQGEGCP